jgi:outer membrane receptor protein involved in Fe transport
LAAFGAALGILLIQPESRAQDAPAADDDVGSVMTRTGGVEEITVTTRKKQENLQSLPLPVAAFSEDDLEVRGIESLYDLALHTAGLEFATTGNVGGDRPIIRGLSQQTRVGDETNVATFIDGVYSPGFSGSTPLFDALDRVEVVRGPQSASYGRNSFAGAINYISKKPGDVTDYGARGTLGTDEHAALSTYLTGPIIEGSLAGRLDFAYRDSGGTFKNAVDGEVLSSKETLFGRAAARWTAGRVVVDGSVTYTEDDYSPSARTTISPNDPRRVGKPAGAGNPFETGAVIVEGGDLDPPRFGRRLQGEIRDQDDVFSIDPRAGGERAGVFTILGITVDLDEYEFVSLSGYQTREVISLSDVDRHPYGNTYSSALTRPPPNEGESVLIGDPLTIQSVTGSREDRDEFSQDLRLSFTAEAPLTWSVGAYFSTEDFQDQRIRAGNPALQYYSTTCPEEIYGSPPPTECLVTAAIPQLSLNQDAILENEFYSVYGGVEWRFLETWALTVEGRQTWENKSANNLAHNFPSNSLPEGDFGTRRFDYFTPRINLSDQVTDDVLLYVLASKGVKSGGFNANALCTDDREYDTEENWTYELGGKFTLWDARATLNLAGFFIDWTDQQITGSGFESDCVTLSTEPVTRNVAATEVWGSEVEMTAVPLEWLSMNLSYTFLDGEYTDAVFQTSQGWIDCPEIGTIDCVFDPVENALVSSGRGDGNQLVNTSRHLFNVGAEVRQPIGVDGWDAFFRTDFSWQDKRYVDSENIGWVPARENVNVRLGVRNERWSAEGFCNNLTDDHTPVTSFPPRDFVGVPSIEVTNRTGRICGLTVGFRHGGGA